MQVDYLIVGQGLAGTVLAHRLLQKGRSFVVVNPAQSRAASRVAAGIFNPLTGLRLSKTWMADTLFPVLHRFYADVEQRLGQVFLHRRDIYRPYRSFQEQNEWFSKTAQEAYQPYIDTEKSEQPYAAWIQQPFGGLHSTQSGYVDLPLLLDSSQNYFRERGVYREGFVKPENLQIEDSSVLWQDIEARFVVFCEGAAVASNPLFRDLPFSFVKGELLEVEIPECHLPVMVNQGLTVLPTRAATFKLASTYRWQDYEWECTTAAREELIEKAQKILKVPFSITQQLAGLRPATQSKRPLMGRHPDYPRLVLFNGLGSKGVSLAPYWAERLLGFLEAGEALPEEIDIQSVFRLS